MTDEGQADYKTAVEEMLDTPLRIAVKAGAMKDGRPTPSLAGVITTAPACSVWHGPSWHCDRSLKDEIDVIELAAILKRQAIPCVVSNSRKSI